MEYNDDVHFTISVTKSLGGWVIPPKLQHFFLLYCFLFDFHIKNIVSNLTLHSYIINIHKQKKFLINK